MYRARHMMNKSVTILRPSLAVDVTTIRDRILAGYTTIATSVPIYIEPSSSNLVRDPQLGATPFDMSIGYVEGNRDVAVNDIIVDGSTYYSVDGVLDYSGFRMHRRLDLTRRNFSTAQ